MPEKVATKLLVLALFAGLSAWAIPLQLGGPRGVVCDYEQTGDRWEIRVEFLAVHCFAEEENLRLNRVYAKRYALTAVAKVLEQNNIGAKNCQVCSETNGNRYSALISCEGITVLSEEEEENLSGEKALVTPMPMSGSLLTCADDWQNMLDTVLEGVLERHRNILEKLKEGEGNASVDLENFLGDELALLSSLTNQIDKDVRLLHSERDGLLDEIECEKTALQELIQEEIKEYAIAIPVALQPELLDWQSDCTDKALLELFFSKYEQIKTAEILLLHLKEDQYALFILGKGAMTPKKQGEPIELTRARTLAKTDATARRGFLSMKGATIVVREVMTENSWTSYNQDGKEEGGYEVTFDILECKSFGNVRFLVKSF